jgi:hypothetical protein
MRTTARERNLIRRVRRLHRLRREAERLADGLDRKAHLAALEGAQKAAVQIDAYVLGLIAPGVLKGLLGVHHAIDRRTKG